MIVVVIIGILAAIAIPIFANQQKAAVVAGIKSDVKNTNTNITTALAKNPTSTDVSLLVAEIVQSDPDTIITIGGTWDNYYIHAVNKNIGALTTVAPNTKTSDVTIPGTTKNISVVNGDFETGISGWSSSSTANLAVTHEVSSPITGDGSIKLTRIGTSGSAVSGYTPITFEEGDIVTFSGDYSSNEISNRGSINLSFGPSLRTASALSPTTPNQTVRLTQTWTVTAANAAAITQFRFTLSINTTGQTFYYDNLTLTVTTPSKTSSEVKTEGYAPSSTAGFGITYSSSTGKFITQNG